MRELLAFARRLALVVFVALLVPTAASAHIRTFAVAVDDRVDIFPLASPLRAVLAARVSPGDQALRITVRRGHTVIVLGYLGEPFLRIDRTGVAVNASSPTAAAVGLARPSRAPSRVTPAWHLEVGRTTASWRDARLRAPPSGIQRVTWAVPLVVDGRLVRLKGEVRRVRAPSPWPWLALGTPLLALAALLLVRRRSLVRPAAVTFGVVSALGTVAIAATFAFSASASAGTWIEGTIELVFVVAGVAVLARGSADARCIAGGALGLLGVSAGSTKIPVFLHGVVLSASPAAATRVSVALTISAGVAAAAVGLAVFFELVERPDPRFRSLNQVRSNR